MQPGARTNEVAGRHEDRIRVRIQAPPVDGKANRSLCSFLAEILGIKKSQLAVEKGFAGRRKSVIISDVNENLWTCFLKKYDNLN